MNPKRLVVAGGGAAGFFAAISAAENGFDGEIIILEKSTRVLAKVLVSGGGRCNVTHACFDNSSLVRFYPRGEQELRGPFFAFSAQDTINWFESKGVRLHTEADGRIFPATNHSVTIADCLQENAVKNNIRVMMQTGAVRFHKNSRFSLILSTGAELTCDYLILATGGGPKEKDYQWITEHGHTILPPVPSLFTFNILNSPLKGLEGSVIKEASVKIVDSPFHCKGPVLVTHWGLSGPAILKLSAFAARYLYDTNYRFTVSVAFLPHREDTTRELVKQQRSLHPTRNMTGDPPEGLTSRLWQRLCELSEIPSAEKWGQLKKENIHLLVQNLHGLQLNVSGKTTFKEEFVTCGGINLKEINMKTMQSKQIDRLYFAGELINVDGLTGGFNFQNAWTTGWIAGKSIAENANR